MIGAGFAQPGGRLRLLALDALDRSPGLVRTINVTRHDGSAFGRC